MYKILFSAFIFIKKILANIFKFKEVFFGILISILSGGIGAILALSIIELNSGADKKNLEISENQEKIISKIALIEKNIEDAKQNNSENKLYVEKLNLSIEELLKTDEKYGSIEREINNINESIKMLEKQTYNIDSDLSILRKILKVIQD